MMRDGHLDVCVLRAFQIFPAVGGAMDPTVGAQSVVVMITLLANDGIGKLLYEHTYHVLSPQWAYGARTSREAVRRIDCSCRP